jgi:hypothetical protein
MDTPTGRAFFAPHETRPKMDDAGLDYPFMDASHFKYHANAAAEPVLAVRGITTESKSAFIGLDPMALGSSRVRTSKAVSRCRTSC